MRLRPEPVLPPFLSALQTGPVEVKGWHFIGDDLSPYALWLQWDWDVFSAWIAAWTDKAR
jgi:hypothetical protein